MRYRLSLTLLALLPGLPGSTVLNGNCVKVDAPVVTAADLAQRSEAFHRFPPEHRFGFAPDPGMTRVISAAELNRHLTAAAKVTQQAASPTVDQGICVVRISRRITEQETVSAIRTAFRGRGVQVEVLDLSKQVVAISGEVRFSIHELPSLAVAATPVTWNGWFVEPHGRRRPVWARVKLKELARLVVARKDIAAGEQLSAENIGEDLRESFPWTRTQPGLPESFIGKTVRGAILTGEAIVSDRLTQTPVIRKGDSVILETITPHTRLAVEGKAESTAYRGQRVAITTVLSKKVIQAVAQGAGRAIVSPTGPQAFVGGRALPAKGKP